MIRRSFPLLNYNLRRALFPLPNTNGVCQHVLHFVFSMKHLKAKKEFHFFYLASQCILPFVCKQEPTFYFKKSAYVLCKSLLGQPNPESHSTMRFRNRLPLSVEKYPNYGSRNVSKYCKISSYICTTYRVSGLELYFFTMLL